MGLAQCVLGNFHIKSGTAKCMDYHQINTVIIPIDFTMSCHCPQKVKIGQQSAIYAFIHLFVPQNQIMKQ